MQQTIYKHHNGDYYRIIDHCSVQVNNVWVDGYVYVEADKFNSIYSRKFVRPVQEFHDKFSPVLDEQTLLDIGDGISLLDHIRQGQLSDIFGKYKLF